MRLREVLLVDDSDADLLYGRVILESAGVAQRVSAFETAREVLDYLQRPEGHEVDVILLDINMPEMNGFEFLEAYEQLHRSHQAHAVVVMLTSSPDPADRARAAAFECVKDYVIKPIDRAQALQLPEVVRRASGAP